MKLYFMLVLYPVNPLHTKNIKSLIFQSITLAGYNYVPKKNFCDLMQWFLILDVLGIITLTRTVK